MLLGKTGGGTAALVARNHVEVYHFIVMELTANIWPRAHIFGLFLYPNKFIGLVIFRLYFQYLYDRGRIQLLDTNDCHILTFVSLLFFKQVIVYFACTKQYALHLFNIGIIIIDQLVKFTIGKLLQLRHAFGAAQ